MLHSLPLFDVPDRHFRPLFSCRPFPSCFSGHCFLTFISIVPEKSFSLSKIQISPKKGQNSVYLTLFVPQRHFSFSQVHFPKRCCTGTGVRDGSSVSTRIRSGGIFFTACRILTSSSSNRIFPEKEIYAHIKPSPHNPRHCSKQDNH